MKKLILFFVVVLIVGCYKNDEGTSSNKDPLIRIWTGITCNDYTFEYNIRDNGTFTFGYTNVDIDESGNGTWISNATEPNFTNRSQTYLSDMETVGEPPKKLPYSLIKNLDHLLFLGLSF